MFVLKSNLIKKCFAVTLFSLYFFFLSQTGWAQLSHPVLWMETECPLENLSQVTDSKGINYIVDICGNIIARDQYGVLWKNTLSGERVKAQPILGQDGSLYILSYSGNLHCLDSNGNELWQLQLSLNENEKCIYAPLTDSENIIFIVTNRGQLFCIEDGVQKWNLSTALSEKVSAVLSSKYFIVNDETGRVYFIDKSGKTRKTINLVSELITNPSLSPDNVYYVSNNSGKYFLNILSLNEQQLGSLTKKEIPYVPVSDVTPSIDSTNRLWILTRNGVVTYKDDVFQASDASETVLSVSSVVLEEHLCFLTDDKKMNININTASSEPVKTSALNVYSVSSDISSDFSGNIYVSALSNSGTGQVWQYETSWRLDLGAPWPMAGQYPGYGRGDWYNYSLVFQPDITSVFLPISKADALTNLNRFTVIEVILGNTGKEGLPYSLELTGNALEFIAWKDSVTNEDLSSWKLQSSFKADEQKRVTIQCVRPFGNVNSVDLQITCSFPGTYFSSIVRNVHIEVIPDPEPVVDLNPAGYAAKCIGNNNNLYCVSGQTLYRISQDSLIFESTPLPFPVDDITDYIQDLKLYSERPSLTIFEKLLYVTMGEHFAVFNMDTFELINDFGDVKFKNNLHTVVDSDQSVYLVREDDKNIIYINDIKKEITDVKSEELPDPEPERGVFVNPLILQKGDEKRLYVPGRDGKLTVWKDNKLLYKFQTGGALMSRPVLIGEQLLMPSWDGFLYIMGWGAEADTKYLDLIKPGVPENIPPSERVPFLERIAQLNFNQPLDHSPFTIGSSGFMITGRGDLFKFNLSSSYKLYDISRIVKFNLPDSVSWWHSNVAYSDKNILVAFYPALQKSDNLSPMQLLFLVSLEDYSVVSLNIPFLKAGERVLDIIDSGGTNLFFMTSFGRVILFSLLEIGSQEIFQTVDSPDVIVF